MGIGFEIVTIIIIAAILVMERIISRRHRSAVVGIYRWEPRDLGRQVVMPVCSCCKKVRTAAEEWVDIDIYPYQAADARLSYTYCPLCEARLLQRENEAGFG